MSKSQNNRVVNKIETGRVVNKIDFHIHTIFSPDSVLSINEIKGICASLGIIPAITDHNTVRAHRHITFPAILGEEIRSEEGDIIGLYVSELIPKGLSAEETIDRVHDQGGIVVLPHMYDPYRHGVGLYAKTSTLKMADAIEVHNGRCMDAFDTKAMEFCVKHALISVAGSDAHNASEVGNCFVEFKDEIDVDAISDNPKYLVKLLSSRKASTKCIRRASLFERLKTRFVHFKKSVFHDI